MMKHGRMPWVHPDLDLNAIGQHDVTHLQMDTGPWRGKYTFFANRWIEKEWGRYFDVVEINPLAEVYQSAVVLRKR
jgi:hypothetical protein